MDRIIGISPIKDEEECIRGWYHNIKHFCDWVIALVDPRSSDNTIKILQNFAKTDKHLLILSQNLSLGDSTREVKGIKGEITYIHNINMVIQWQPKDSWLMWLAADERLDLRDKGEIMRKLEFAEKNSNDSIIFEIYDIYDEKYRIGWEHSGMDLIHRKIFRPTARFGTTSHSGCTGINNPLKTNIPFYHFKYVRKRNRVCWWTTEDKNNNKKTILNVPKLMELIPEDKRLIKCKIPFKDWRNEL